jgi:transposase
LGRGEPMLSEKQMQCINLMVIENKTQKQIAKELKITEQTICNWKKDKEFKNEIENNIKENFGSLALDAQKELKKLLKSNNEYIKMQAVKDILDRAGYKPVERREIKDDTEKTKKIDAISDILNQMQSADDV